MFWAVGCAFAIAVGCGIAGASSFDANAMAGGKPPCTHVSTTPAVCGSLGGMKCYETKEIFKSLPGKKDILCENGTGELSPNCSEDDFCTDDNDASTDSECKTPGS